MRMSGRRYFSWISTQEFHLNSGCLESLSMEEHTLTAADRAVCSCRFVTERSSKHLRQLGAVRHTYHFYALSLPSRLMYSTLIPTCKCDWHSSYRLKQCRMSFSFEKVNTISAAGVNMIQQMLTSFTVFPLIWIYDQAIYT